MDKQQLKNARFFGSAEGGNIICHTPDGDIKWTLGVQSQILRGVDLLAYVERSDEISLEGGVSAIIAGAGRLRSVRSPLATESGANPDFQPAALSQAEATARKLMKDVQAQSKALERRMKSFEEAHAANPPQKPQRPDPEPVVEDETAEDPKKGETVEQVERGQ